MALIKKVKLPESAGTVLYANANDLNKTQTQPDQKDESVYDVLGDYQQADQSKIPTPVQDTGFTPEGYETKEFEAQKQDVAPEGMVENRLTGLLSRENPYLKQAETQGKQAAARRGLLNTSMGVQAAEGARISAALPIAQQDAEAFNRQRLTNQQYVNQARQFNATVGTDANKYFADVTNQGNMAMHDANIREQLARFDQDRSMDLESLKSRYSILENRDSGIAQMYSNYLNDIKDILNNKDLSGERRKDALDAIGAGINSVMDFYASSAGIGGGVPAGTAGTAGTAPAGEAPATGEQPSGEAPAGGLPSDYARDPQDPFSYPSVNEMPYAMQQAWRSQYGETLTGKVPQPTQIGDLQQAVLAERSRWEEYIDTTKDPQGPVSVDGGRMFPTYRNRSYDGLTFTNPYAKQQYNDAIEAKMVELGFTSKDQRYPKGSSAFDYLSRWLS